MLTIWEPTVWGPTVGGPTVWGPTVWGPTIWWPTVCYNLGCYSRESYNLGLGSLLCRCHVIRGREHSTKYANTLQHVLCSTTHRNCFSASLRLCSKAPVAWLLLWTHATRTTHLCTCSAAPRISKHAHCMSTSVGEADNRLAFFAWRGVCSPSQDGILAAWPASQ
jgi:hypothetical protein